MDIHFTEKDKVEIEVQMAQMIWPLSAYPLLKSPECIIEIGVMYLPTSGLRRAILCRLFRPN
jgi:hypothetical protein